MVMLLTAILSLTLIACGKLPNSSTSGTSLPSIHSDKVKNRSVYLCQVTHMFILLGTCDTDRSISVFIMSVCCLDPLRALPCSIGFLVCITIFIGM